MFLLPLTFFFELRGSVKRRPEGHAKLQECCVLLSSAGPTIIAYTSTANGGRRLHFHSLCPLVAAGLCFVFSLPLCRR